MVSSKSELSRSLSPIFWFIRGLGCIPFYHHDDSTDGAFDLAFKWCHPQTFWFGLVTLAHFLLICLQVFGGLFTIPIDHGSPFRARQTDHWLDLISQACFFVDSFLVSKLMLFHWTSLKKFFGRLEGFDRMIDPAAATFSTVRPLWKMIALVISISLTRV